MMSLQLFERFYARLTVCNNYKNFVESRSLKGKQYISMKCIIAITCLVSVTLAAVITPEHHMVMQDMCGNLPDLSLLGKLYVLVSYESVNICNCSTSTLVS